MHSCRNVALVHLQIVLWNSILQIV